jgi:DNA-binding FadR family transcriptional regulator
VYKKPLSGKKARKAEPIPENIDVLGAFAKKFHELIVEAQANGVDVVVLLHFWDQFKRNATFRVNSTDSSGYVIRGMLDDASEILEGGVVLMGHPDEDGQGAKQ